MINTVVLISLIVFFATLISAFYFDYKNKYLGTIIFGFITVLTFIGVFTIAINNNTFTTSEITETKTLPQFRIDKQAKMAYWLDDDVISEMKLSDAKFIVVDARRPLGVGINSESLPCLCRIETETYDVGYWFFIKLVSGPTMTVQNYILIPSEMATEYLDETLDWTALSSID